jgi:TIR domain
MEPEELIVQETVTPETEPAEMVADETETGSIDAEPIDAGAIDEGASEDHEATDEEFDGGPPDEDEHADVEDHVEKRPAIFISYNHNENDYAVAGRIYNELSPYCDVFLDDTRVIGENFPKQAEDFLNRADFVIALVSPPALTSQWVRAELEHVVERAKKEGRPTVIPIRINYEGPLTLILRAYIGHFNAYYWDNRNYAALFEKLHATIAAKPLPLSTPTITDIAFIQIKGDLRLIRAETFVQPRELPTTGISFNANRLLWLTGDASVRNYVANAVAAQTLNAPPAASNGNAPPPSKALYEITRARRWSEINNTYISDSTIVLLDALPAPHLSDSGAIAEWHSLRAIIERNNIVIATAPQDEFERLEGDLLRYQFTDYQHYELSRDPYSEKDKRDIFTRLIEHKNTNGELDEDKYTWASELLKESSEVVRAAENRPRARALEMRRREARAQFQKNLQTWSPPDIERFVGSLLMVRSEGDILKLLKRSAALEDEIRAWFISLDDSVRCFILTLSLFPNLIHDQLWDKYKTITEHLRRFDQSLRLLPFGICRKRAQPNVSVEGPICFVDDRVADAVGEEVARSYREYFVELLPKLNEWSVPPGRNANTPEQKAQRKTKVEETRETRESIARMIGIAGRVSLDGLSEVLDYWATDPDFHVRKAVALALEQTAKSQTGRNHALNLLDQWCLDLNANGPVKWHSLAASIALGHVAAAAGDGYVTMRAFQALRAFARSRSPVARFYASIALKQFARLASLATIEDTLSRLAKDERSKVRLNVAAALNEARATSEKAEAAEALIERWIHADNENHRWVALCAIVTSRRNYGGTDKYARLLNYLDDKQTASALGSVLGEIVADDHYGATAKDVFLSLSHKAQDEAWNNLASGLGAAPLANIEKELLPRVRFRVVPPFDERAIDLRREVLKKKLDDPPRFLTTVKSWLAQEQSNFETFRALAMLLENVPDSSRSQFVTSMGKYFAQNPAGVNELLAGLEKLAPVYFDSLSLEVRREAFRLLLQHPARFVTLAYQQLTNAATAVATEESLDLLVRNDPFESRQLMSKGLLAGYEQTPIATRDLLLALRSSGNQNLAKIVHEFYYGLIEAGMSTPATFPGLLLELIQQDSETFSLLNYLADPGPLGQREKLVNVLVEAMLLRINATDQLLALPAMKDWINLASLAGQVSRGFYVKRIFSTTRIVTSLFTPKFIRTDA